MERARALGNRPYTALEPLHFYELVLRFQAGMGEGLEVAFDFARPLREQIDREFVMSTIDEIRELALKHGPKALADRARELGRLNKDAWVKMLESAMASKVPENALDDFFSRACLQPIAEKLQVQIPAYQHYLKNICPACGALPQLSILRPEGEGATRSLLCSFCLREWTFRRIICPSCGEANKEKLPRYSDPECGYIAVEACETCMRYLKSVDMTVEGYAEPLVDEAAVAALDLWATERGYKKIVRNLIGF
jgi:formate dehydrogenase accessory protein FdhE